MVCTTSGILVMRCSSNETASETDGCDRGWGGASSSPRRRRRRCCSCWSGVSLLLLPLALAWVLPLLWGLPLLGVVVAALGGVAVDGFPGMTPRTWTYDTLVHQTTHHRENKRGEEKTRDVVHTLLPTDVRNQTSYSFKRKNQRL